MISYFVYTIISLGCSYAVYVLLLRKQKTFQFNRFFLIGSLLLCLVAPFMEIELFKAVPSITEIPLEKFTASVVETQPIEDVTFGEAQQVDHSQKSPFFYVYFIITLFLVFRFLKNLSKIYGLTRNEYEYDGKLKVIKSTDSDMVSSFFNYMFIPKQNTLSRADYKSIIAHETVHSEELHSVDIILLELLSCIFWFNPFIWLYKKSTLQNHEFRADEKSVSSGIDIENYSNTIINLGQKEYRVPLTSGFNFIQIKNRIIMLHQSKSSVFKRTLNIISVSLLLAGIFVLSSYKDLKEPLVVVIDAGHGGHDSGNLDEKNIVLNISHQLSLLSSDNIRIITTRTEDTFFTLQERVEFISTQNADLVVSLHANAHSNPLTNGVEAYYNDKDEFKDKSYAFGKILLENQMELFSTNRGLKTVPMYIFRHINSPGVLLELGFITNEEDHKVLMNVDRQKQIAASIFEGLEEIRKSN
ncbi:N-acetylmuramoyl-L-alanine amidase [Winogradskyella psychrotolerans RS-3]|uniref:N-acetylmuramoyl-L-alanine amidase n=1 Tax=Winogradskyella psychrotolerans RS-3 TaxID=641526 RepID=S7VRZ6_9FLAO|nr:N-acetylmuramoyl-L-alanine amidase [Winogradskyella psychrotolerans]EPR72147.1 N-acetylmuramoyl-L-alanine amidase [Winogradskyella psychrotolerans RS-3]